MNAAVSAVTTHGFTMGYFTFGNGKTPFVMLPGISIKPITTFAPAVANAYKDLAGDFTFYVFNTRADLPDNYSLYDAARDTAAVLDELGISRACVFGVSMGGMIAQVLAVNRPDLVGKLVLGSSASRITEQAKKIFRHFVSLAQNGDMQALAQDFAQAVYTPRSQAAFKEAMLAALSDITQQEIEQFITLTKAIIGFDIYEKLDSITSPLLAIGAQQDKIFGAQASAEIAEKAHGEVYICKDYRHAAYDEDPDYHSRLYEFFTRKGE